MSRLPPPTLAQPDQLKPSVSALQEIAIHAAPATIGHAFAAQNLLSRSIARTVSNGVFTTGLAGHFMDLQTWEELLQLQKAVIQRMEQQHRSWLNGCAILIEEYAQLKQANTMSKLVEGQYNLLAQWGQLLGNQATNLIGLQENIEVDYGYWASQKLRS